MADYTLHSTLARYLLWALSSAHFVLWSYGVGAVKGDRKAQFKYHHELIGTYLINQLQPDGLIQNVHIP